MRVLSQLWHRIQVGRTGGGVSGQSAQPIVAQDSGGEYKGLSDWSECSANCGTGFRLEDIGWSDWSECSVNCGTGFRWEDIGCSDWHRAQPMVDEDSGGEDRRCSD